MMAFIKKIGRTLGLLGQAADSVGAAVDVWDKPKEDPREPHRPAVQPDLPDDPLDRV